MSSINDDSVNTSLYKRFHSLESVGCDAYACCDAETAFRILTCHWLVSSLCDVLIGDKSKKLIVAVNYWQFLNLMLKQNL